MSDPNVEPGHGHSPAAWTGVIIMLIAVTAGTVFFIFDMPLLVLASLGLLIVGFLIGWALSKAGYGAYGPKYAPKEH